MVKNKKKINGTAAFHLSRPRSRTCLRVAHHTESTKRCPSPVACPSTAYAQYNSTLSLRYIGHFNTFRFCVLERTHRRFHRRHLNALPHRTASHTENEALGSGMSAYVLSPHTSWLCMGMPCKYKTATDKMFIVSVVFLKSATSAQSAFSRRLGRAFLYQLVLCCRSYSVPLFFVSPKQSEYN